MQVTLSPDFGEYLLNDAATRAFTAGTANCFVVLSDSTIFLIAGESGILTLNGSHTGSTRPTLDLATLPLPPDTVLPSGLTVSYSPGPNDLSTPFTTTVTVATTATLDPGSYTLFVAGLDDACNALGTSTVNVESDNQPPVCNAGPIAAQVYEVECEGGATTVVLDGTDSSDPDGDALTSFWRDLRTDTLFGSGSATPTLVVDTSTGPCSPLLSFDVELTVIDPEGAFDVCTSTVAIQDTTAPAVSVDSTPIELTDCDCSAEEG